MFLFFSSAIYLFFCFCGQKKRHSIVRLNAVLNAIICVADKIPSIYEKCAKSTVSKDR